MKITALLIELTAESALLDLPEPVPFFPVVDVRTAELALLDPPAFVPRPGVPVLVAEPRAQVASCGDFLIPPGPAFPGLLPVVSRLGGLHTSGSSMGKPEEVGYSSKG